jgi:hypothetical protein
MGSDPNHRSACDALEPPSPSEGGRLTFLLHIGYREQACVTTPANRRAECEGYEGLSDNPVPISDTHASALKARTGAAAFLALTARSTPFRYPSLTASCQ